MQEQDEEIKKDTWPSVLTLHIVAMWDYQIEVGLFIFLSHPKRYTLVSEGSRAED